MPGGSCTHTEGPYDFRTTPQSVKYRFRRTSWTAGERTPVGIKVLALDLERTLISDAMTADPRPGVFDFLTFCHEHFGRVAVFTTVEAADAREVLEGFGSQRACPVDRATGPA